MHARNRAERSGAKEPAIRYFLAKAANTPRRESWWGCGDPSPLFTHPLSFALCPEKSVFHAPQMETPRLRERTVKQLGTEPGREPTSLDSKFPRVLRGALQKGMPRFWGLLRPQHSAAPQRRPRAGRADPQRREDESGSGEPGVKPGRWSWGAPTEFRVPGGPKLCAERVAGAWG